MAPTSRGQKGGGGGGGEAARSGEGGGDAEAEWARGRVRRAGRQAASSADAASGDEGRRGTEAERALRACSCRSDATRVPRGEVTEGFSSVAASPAVMPAPPPLSPALALSLAESGASSSDSAGAGSRRTQTGAHERGDGVGACRNSRPDIYVGAGCAGEALSGAPAKKPEVHGQQRSTGRAMKALKVKSGTGGCPIPRLYQLSPSPPIHGLLLQVQKRQPITDLAAQTPHVE